MFAVRFCCQLGIWAAAVLAVVPAAAYKAPLLLQDFHFDNGKDTVSADDHFNLGTSIGKSYEDVIQERMAKDMKPLQAFLASTAGKKIFNELLVYHNKTAPAIILELEGIAHGSNVPFETIFAVSLSEEIQYFKDPASVGKTIDQCSDYMMCTDAHCVDAHNEDGGYKDRVFFTAHVRLGRTRFTTVNYVGDLLGGMAALSFNAHGLAFSLNWLGPAGCVTNGLGRNFISRMLLEARSWDEAVGVISQRHAAGHNYQLMDFAHRRIANFEAANGVHSSHAIKEPFFHVNQYKVLNITGQKISPSSAHRTARLSGLPKPRDGAEILAILGDQGDRLYPIYHDELSHKRGELSDWTLATALFDLDEGTISLMDGNPANKVVKRKFSVPGFRARSSTAIVV